jgi:hypothetical protein
LTRRAPLGVWWCAAAAGSIRAAAGRISTARAARRMAGVCPLHSCRKQSCCVARACTVQAITQGALDAYISHGLAFDDGSSGGGWTILQLACLFGRHAVVAQLLEAGADPNQPCSGAGNLRPLHLACMTLPTGAGREVRRVGRGALTVWWRRSVWTTHACAWLACKRAAATLLLLPHTSLPARRHHTACVDTRAHTLRTAGSG